MCALTLFKLSIKVQRSLNIRDFGVPRLDSIVSPSYYNKYQTHSPALNNTMLNSHPIKLLPSVSDGSEGAGDVSSDVNILLYPVFLV